MKNTWLSTLVPMVVASLAAAPAHASEDMSGFDNFQTRMIVVPLSIGGSSAFTIMDTSFVLAGRRVPTGVAISEVLGAAIQGAFYAQSINEESSGRSVPWLGTTMTVWSGLLVAHGLGTIIVNALTPPPVPRAAATAGLASWAVAPSYTPPLHGAGAPAGLGVQLAARF